jgi:hypothetical protein
MRACHFALACLLLSGSAAAQQAPVAAARVVGVVVDAETDIALRRARIAITAAASRLAPVFTDELGHFFLDVSGDVTLTISKAGYASEIVKFASSRESPAELRVVMKRGGVITGRVVDGLGVPALAATVAVHLVPPATDADTPTPVLTALTDDRGEFRFGGLPGGEFQVGAIRGVIDGRQTPFSPDPFFIAVASGVSARVRPGDSVDVGELVVGADTKLYSGGALALDASGRDASGRVTGQVRDRRGRPMKVVVHLTRDGATTKFATSDPQGRYSIDRVSAGSYFAEVSRPGMPATRYGQRFSSRERRSASATVRPSAGSISCSMQAARSPARSGTSTASRSKEQRFARCKSSVSTDAASPLQCQGCRNKPQTTAAPIASSACCPAGIWSLPTLTDLRRQAIHHRAAGTRRVSIPA